METIKGSITKIANGSGTSKTTGKPYKNWVFEINGKNYGTFDEKIGTAFNVGDLVVMTGEPKGQYWNMASMVKDTAVAQEEFKAVIPTNDMVVDLLRQILAELKEINRGMVEDGNN